MENTIEQINLTAYKFMPMDDSNWIPADIGLPYNVHDWNKN